MQSAFIELIERALGARTENGDRVNARLNAKVDPETGGILYMAWFTSYEGPLDQADLEMLFTIINDHDAPFYAVVENNGIAVTVV